MDVVDDAVSGGEIRLIQIGLGKQAVDREVASAGILLGIREADLVGASSVGVGPFGSEGRDLGDISALAFGAGRVDNHDAKGGADRCRLWEDRLDLLGRRIRRYVIVLGLGTHQCIANTAPGQIGGVALVFQPGNDLHGGESGI